VSGIHVDQLGYALGEVKTSLRESELAGRLLSPAADLADAGFAWHHICKPGTTAYDLAHDAVAQLAGRAGAVGDADAIVYATALPVNGNIGDLAAWRSSRDVTHLMEFPASQLQADFCLDRAAVFGLNQQGCTGMLGAVRLAGVLLTAEASWQRVLCVTADRFPDGAIYEQAYNLVSDAAAACVVSRSPGAFRLVTAHQITNGGLGRATNDERVGTYFSYTRQLIDETLQRAGLTIADIAWIIPQNTHRRAWQIMARQLGVAVERVWRGSVGDVGHAIAADNIINLASLANSGRLHQGERIVLLMAGHGLNWQAVLLEAAGEPS
jgi:3-oxoacyl-[acyl-carrier-protein] synthase-3